jgi:hypothetical protein
MNEAAVALLALGDGSLSNISGKYMLTIDVEKDASGLPRFTPLQFQAMAEAVGMKHPELVTPTPPVEAEPVPEPAPAP